ncbi:MAG: adenosylcobinamide-phosphate synthase CbiB [Pseudoruegeria sp.]
MEHAWFLVIALLLDAVFGEPKWLWTRFQHPAVFIGRIIARLDTRFNAGPNRKRNGVLCILGLCILAWSIGGLISALPDFGILEIALTAILLAQRSLVDHVRAVADGLRVSLGNGRTSVAMIVGRDTADMTESAIARAAIESAAENQSDGVIAPAFWFLLLGLPGLLVYKVINTADSMIGYKTDKHRDFGWASARIDDVVNWIPARLTALLIAITHGKFSCWPQIRQDAPLHRSPNAGWPEAAMAVVMNIALSGPRSYDGQLRDFPYVNAIGKRDIGPAEIEAATHTLWRSWAGFITLTLLLTVI